MAKKTKKKNPSTKLRVKVAAKKKKVVAKKKKKIVAKKKKPVAKKKKIVARKKPFGKLRARRKIFKKAKSIIDISKEKFDYFMAKIAAI